MQQPPNATRFYPRLLDFIAQCLDSANNLPPQRAAALDALVRYIRDRRNERQPVTLTFICTHNSRRSQMAQVWAATAAAYHGIDGIHVHSGGTEATAFNPRAVGALERAGFRITPTTGGANPVYHVRYTDADPPITCFSKLYNQPPNPPAGFCAVMTCAHAEANCPVVHGATQRIAILYDDPKEADGIPEEARRYDERCRQIAVEMLYVFSRVNAAAAGVKGPGTGSFG